MQHLLSLHGLSVVKDHETLLAAHSEQPSLRRSGESGQSTAFLESNRALFRPREIAEHHLVAGRGQAQSNERLPFVCENDQRMGSLNFQIRQAFATGVPDFEVLSL